MDHSAEIAAETEKETSANLSNEGIEEGKNEMVIAGKRRHKIR